MLEHLATLDAIAKIAVAQRKIRRESPEPEYHDGYLKLNRALDYLFQTIEQGV